MKSIVSLPRLFNCLLLAICIMFPGLLFGADDWFERGLSNLRAHRYDEAVKAFSKVIETKPFHIKAYNNRGIAWCKKGVYDQAMMDYDSALRIDPGCAEAYCNRGAIWFYKGNYDRAIADYDRVLEIEPLFAKAYTNRGAAWFCKGDYDRAIADYSKALEINPNCAETNRQMVWILARTSKLPAGGAPEGPKIPPAYPEQLSTPPAVPPQPADQKIAKIAPFQSSGYAMNNENKSNKSHHPLVDHLTQSPPKTAYSVQVGAFLSKDNADNLSILLHNKGYPARLVPIKDWKKRIWYTVRIGDYSTQEEAKAKATAFSTKEEMPSTVRPVNKL